MTAIRRLHGEQAGTRGRKRPTRGAMTGPSTVASALRVVGGEKALILALPATVDLSGEVAGA